VEPKKKLLGLVQRRECWVPTWRGWLGLCAGLIGLTVLVVRGVYPFLAVTDPLPSGVLVIEGWADDDAMKAVIREFKQHHYEKLYVTGGPIDRGAPLFEYKTYAEGGAAILVRLGLSTNEVQAVPAPRVRQDRTYTSALALKRWWQEHGLAPTQVHLISAGPHARRSRLLFRKALGRGVAVGVTAMPIWDYDPEHWWRSSAGVRSVSDEALAYLYARFLFREKGG